MACIKRNLENNFDQFRYDDLVGKGFTEEEVYMMWESFSHKSWEDWKGGK